jgi:hypothetical protein
MAIKTFTTGELLSSSDTNTYLANSGLVYVTSATIGTAVSSVAVANAFSATYDNYKIVAHGGIGNTFQAISMTLTGAATSYYQILAYWAYAGGAATSAGVSNAAQWTYIGESGDSNTIDIDVLGPNTAKYTQFAGNYIGSVAGTIAGYHAQTTAYTGFTIATAGTMTGGTITVYGYRKA